jgi:hypothetical protein
MKQILAGFLGLTLAACVTPAPVAQAQEIAADEDDEIVLPSQCPPSGWDKAKLEALKAADFEIADAAERERFAASVTACLADPDPALRDGIAFEALYHMLRARQLSDAAMRGLMGDLLERLDAPPGEGFEQPFAALALSEVARADRIAPFLTDMELTTLLVQGTSWLLNVTDYRGFDPKEGWRHGVAHGADLALQLVLNPRMDVNGQRHIAVLVMSQVAPANHAYVFGESERLARPVLFAAARGEIDESEWTRRLTALATPKGEAAEEGSLAWLNWRHNTMSFLQALYMNVVIGSDPKDDVLRPGLEAALKAMP